MTPDTPTLNEALDADQERRNAARGWLARIEDGIANRRYNAARHRVALGLRVAHTAAFLLRWSGTIVVIDRDEVSAADPWWNQGDEPADLLRVIGSAEEVLLDDRRW